MRPTHFNHHQQVRLLQGAVELFAAVIAAVDASSTEVRDATLTLGTKVVTDETDDDKKKKKGPF